MVFTFKDILRHHVWGWMFILSLLFAAFSLVSFNWSATSNITAVSKSWQSYSRENVTKSDTLRAISAKVGYGGAIHSLHNYLIRGREFYLATASAKLADANEDIARYELQNLNEQEMVALATLKQQFAALEELIVSLSLQRENLGAAPRITDQELPIDRKVILNAGLLLKREGQADDSKYTFSRSQALSDLTASFGLGGMIDLFKEAVRGNAVSYQLFGESVIAARKALAAYLTLPLNEAEKNSLEVIEATLDTYASNFAVVEKGKLQGHSIADIDADVFIDDTQAFAALSQLEYSITLQRATSAEGVNAAIKIAQDENEKRLYSLFILMVVVAVIAVVALRDNAKKEEQLISKSEASLRAAERLEKLMEAINDHAIVSRTDTKARIVFCNDKYSEVSGYSPYQVIGSGFSLVNSGFHDKAFFKGMWDTISNGNVWTGEIRNRAKNGQAFWVKSTIAPNYDEAGALIGYTAIETDITDQKTLQEVQAEKLQSAQEASRFKSNFFAAMSHNLRTPLNAIMGFSEALYQQIYGSVGSEKNREYAALIHSSGETLLRLLDDILDASRVEGGKYQMTMENISVSMHLTKLMQNFTAVPHQHGIGIRYEHDSRLKTLVADSSALDQITSNLVSTALRYCKKGDEITVSYSLDKRGSLVISISDPNGEFCKGARKELDNNEIGDSSVAGTSLKGTGLGLYIVSLFAELHGGEFFVHDKLGDDAAVGVVFPESRVNRSAA